ncbi:MAG: HAD family hydrolase [Bdellovibrionales bacterium]
MGPVVLLDLDGTLIDSNDAHAACCVEALGEFGFSVPFEKIRPLIGMGTDQLVPRVVTLEPNSKVFRQLAKRRGEIFREHYLPELVVFPQARELVEKMRSDGLVCVAATSASKEDLQGLLEKIRIQDLIQDATTSGEAESSKR